MGKNQDPGSGIRDKHPGSATLLGTKKIAKKYLKIAYINHYEKKMFGL
jgi:hypothetical protein